ncbi:MAG: hypothetical protein IJF44_06440 [Clostridia bacterium]|nr:hypothetical protein [Clostridia bacterium]
MRFTRKILTILFVVVMLFSTAACEGVYNEAIGDTSSGEFIEPVEPPAMNDDPTDDFTVTLHADGQPYAPRMQMYARWSDGFSVHTSPFNKDGVAKIDGLDGDYRVTLSAVPNEYTYDPNSSLATNDNRNIVLNLYTLNRLSGGGTGPYDCYHFKKTGVYCAVLNNSEEAIFFQYAPERSGTYTIESWADTTADNINPYIEVYGGHSQYKYYITTTDGGGSIGSYTINFIHTVQIADENISSGGQAVYTFAVKADSKNNRYPITVTFAVKRDGDFELNYGPNNSIGKGMAIPKYDFSTYNVADHEYGAGYTKKYPEYKYEGSANTYIFDEKRFKLWETDKGGDGFYHVYDKDLYPETDGYGPILYANVTSANRFLDRAFTQIEYNSNGETINSALTVNGLNYKHFFEGYTFLSTYGNINGGSYYCSNVCPCHDASQGTANWACPPTCGNCDRECRKCPTELIGHEGYQAYANSDGVVAVTEELKEFLLGYCTKQMFFYDGTGTLEKQPYNGVYYQAVGQSGWLFGCVYYERT